MITCDRETLVHPIETKSHFSINQKIRVYTEADNQLGRDFRHRRSTIKRPQILQALVSAGVSQERINRFRECGDNSYVYRSVFDEKKYRIQCFKCHDRFCAQCSFERGRMLVRTIIPKLALGNTRFFTLTLKHSDQPLGEQLDRLYDSYRKLRARKIWRQSQTASIAFTEITWNAEYQQFHVHLHVLSVGRYVPQKDVSKAWLKITGDSYIVDVRSVGNSKEIMKYVTKYAAKGISGAVLLSCGRAVEVILALAGRRLMIRSGAWKNLKAEKVVLDNADWEPVGALAHIIQDAIAGNRESMSILDCLHFTMKEVFGCTTNKGSDSS